MDEQRDLTKAEWYVENDDGLAGAAEPLPYNEACREAREMSLSGVYHVRHQDDKLPECIYFMRVCYTP